MARRSARLSRTALSPSAAAKLAPSKQSQLGSVIERDETPEVQTSSIDNIISTPSNGTLRGRIAELSVIRTPATVPQPSQESMHPELLHQTTAKAPDSALRLGFASPRKALIDTPSKINPRESFASPNFEFKFPTESHLSSEAQKLMENVREEATRIKAQMQAEKNAQEEKDGESEQMFAGISATGRKIAHPKGKAGRFSDVHKAQFRKMDSIANHASAFRARPVFTQPTQQSLKRSGSKAGLDEQERPRTAGKGTPGKVPPPFMRPTSSSSQLRIVKSSSDRLENSSPAKRMRHSEAEDVSANRAQDHTHCKVLSTSAIPRPTSCSLFSPTKSSLARIGGKSPNTAPEKVSTLPRSTSVKSLKTAFEAARPQITSPDKSPSKLPRLDSTTSMRPLPPLPQSAAPQTSTQTLHRSQSTKTLSTTHKAGSLASRLPTFAGLKSILRPSTRKEPVVERTDTPKRPSTANAAVESSKKVDFTPSVKSRYAVKLAANSPSPAKHCGPSTPSDPADYIDEEEMNEEDWEDAESEIEYPTLPPQSSTAETVVQTFSDKAKDHKRRESKEFKSIFTTLHHPSRPTQPSTLTSVNTTVNKTNPGTHANTSMQSPSSNSSARQSISTIRRVRTSDAPVIQPFEDTIQTVPHGLPGKKRRHDSAVEDDKTGTNNDAKENRRVTMMPQPPGSWEHTILDEDEGEKRGGKRMRVAHSVGPSPKKVENKKSNAAREAAAKSAKERKKGGILSMARLNMLSKPKHRI